MPGGKESPKIKWDANAILDGTMWDILREKKIELSSSDRWHIEDIKNAVKIYHEGLKEFDELCARYSKLKESGVAKRYFAACEEILSRLKREDIESFIERFKKNCGSVDGKEKIGRRELDFTVGRLFHALALDTNGAFYSIKDNLDKLKRELDRIEKLASEGHVGELNTDEFMYLLVSKKLPGEVRDKYGDKIVGIENALTDFDVAKQYFIKLDS